MKNLCLLRVLCWKRLSSIVRGCPQHVPRSSLRGSSIQARDLQVPVEASCWSNRQHEAAFVSNKALNPQEAERELQKRRRMGSASATAFVAAVMAAMFFALTRGWYSPEVVVFLSLLVVWNVGILSDAEALEGFNNPAMLVIGALFVVVAAIENSGLAESAARRIFGLSSSFNIGFLRLMLCALALSAFVNNTPVVALLIPIAEDWARSRGFDSALLLMPLSFVCAFGGTLTTVGGGTNLVIQGLLYEAAQMDDTIRPFHFFEPAFVGLPLAIAGVSYLLIAAPRLLGSNADRKGAVHAHGGSDTFLTEVSFTSDFEHLGDPFPLVLSALGLPEQTLVSILRPNIHVAGGDSCATRQRDGPIDHSAGDEPHHMDDEQSRRSHWAGGIKGGATAVSQSASRAAAVAEGVSSPLARGAQGLSSDFLSRKQPPYRRLENDPDVTLEVELPAVMQPCRKVPSPSELNDAARTGEGEASRAMDGEVKAPARGTATSEDSFEVPLGATARAGDIMVLRCDQEALVRATSGVVNRRLKGLKVLGVGLPDAPKQGAVFVKLVLSRWTQLLGRVARLENGFFQERYGFSIIAFRLKEAAVEGFAHTNRLHDKDDNSVHLTLGPSDDKDHAVVNTIEGEEGVALATDEDQAQTMITEPPAIASSESTLLGRREASRACGENGGSAGRRCRRRGQHFEPGDAIIILGSEDFFKRPSSTREFLLIERLGRVSTPAGWLQLFPLLVFAAMVAWVLLCGVSMARAAFAACALLIILDWVDASRAVKHVNWRLLLLIGSALGFSKAIANSGLADYAGDAIQKSGMGPRASLFVLFGFTMVCTELISNNAAAALNIPIALSMARDMQADYKPFAMTVLLAASCSFLTPIGTPTNTMVWAPGRYGFFEYAKLGGPLSVAFWIVASLVVPLAFPF